LGGRAEHQQDAPCINTGRLVERRVETRWPLTLRGWCLAGKRLGLHRPN